MQSGDQPKAAIVANQIGIYRSTATDNFLHAVKIETDHQVTLVKIASDIF